MRKLSSLVSPLADHDDGHDDHHDHEPTVILGTNKDDLIIVGGGPQWISAGNGKDVVYAGGGPDIVNGGSGKDSLFGQGGPDELHGGNGPDVLSGGCGPDQLTGGRGPDIFVYAARREAPARGDHDDAHDGGDDHDHQGGGGDGGDGCAGADRVETITDFQVHVDKIDVSQLAVDSFSDVPDAYAVWVEQEGDDAIVRIDIDGNLSGDHPADMEIVLAGVDAELVSAGDFIFGDDGAMA